VVEAKATDVAITEAAAVAAAAAGPTADGVVPVAVEVPAFFFAPLGWAPCAGCLPGAADGDGGATTEVDSGSGEEADVEGPAGVGTGTAGVADIETTAVVEGTAAVDAGTAADVAAGETGLVVEVATAPTHPVSITLITTIPTSAENTFLTFVSLIFLNYRSDSAKTPTEVNFITQLLVIC